MIGIASMSRSTALSIGSTCSYQRIEGLQRGLQPRDGIGDRRPRRRVG